MLKHEVFRNLVFSQQPGYNDIVYTIDVNKIKATFTKSLYFCLFDSKECPFEIKVLEKKIEKYSRINSKWNIVTFLKRGVSNKRNKNQIIQK